MARKEVAIDDIIDDELVDDAKEVFKRQLNANKRVRKGNGVYEDVDDNAAQLRAAETVLAYKIGRPETRTKNLTLMADLTKGDQEPGSGGKRLVDAEQVVAAMVENGVDLNKIIRRQAAKQLAANDVEVVDI